MVNAVILGGGGEDKRLEGFFGGESKGLIPVGNRACVEYVLEALRATPGVAKIALVGPPALLEHPAARLADVRLAQSSEIVEKLLAAAEALGDERKLLMVCCDSPLLTPESLTDVIEHCPDDCAFFHPLVEKSAALRDFPEHKWVFIRLREGQVVTTNVIVLDPGWLRRRPDLARTLEALRRHPTRLALTWGLGFVLRFKLGLLSMDYCERFFSDFLHAPCRGMICRHSELAMDLDRPEDVALIERRLQGAGPKA